MRVIPITLLALAVASCGSERGLTRSSASGETVRADGLGSVAFFRVPDDPLAGPMIAAPHLGLPRAATRETLAARTTVTIIPFPMDASPDVFSTFPEGPEPTIMSPSPPAGPLSGS